MNRTESKRQFQPDDADLIENALSILSPTWTAAIFILLASGTKRFTEITDLLPGLYARTLVYRLETLIKHGLVERRAFREVPPRVEYSLTDKGWEVVKVLKAVKKVSSKFSFKGFERLPQGIRFK